MSEEHFPLRTPASKGSSFFSFNSSDGAVSSPEDNNRRSNGPSQREPHTPDSREQNNGLGLSISVGLSRSPNRRTIDIPEQTGKVSIRTVDTPLSSPAQVFSDDSPLPNDLDLHSLPQIALSPSSHYSEEKKRAMAHAEMGRSMTEITDYMYVSGQTVAKDKQVLVDGGITLILNACGYECDNHFPDTFAYRSFYLKDRASEDISAVLYDVIEAVDMVRAQNGRVLIHCQQGISRSASLCIAYLMYSQKTDFQATCELVQRKRAISQPNFGFSTGLIAWWQRCTRSELAPEVRLYRVSPPHKSSESQLTARWVEKSDLPPSTLDENSMYILVSLEEQKCFIYTATTCKHLTEFMDFAKVHIGRLQKYEHAPSVVERVDETIPQTHTFWVKMRSLT